VPRFLAVGLLAALLLVSCVDQDQSETESGCLTKDQQAFIFGFNVRGNAYVDSASMIIDGHKDSDSLLVTILDPTWYPKLGAHLQTMTSTADMLIRLEEVDGLEDIQRRTRGVARSLYTAGVDLQTAMPPNIDPAQIDAGMEVLRATAAEMDRLVGEINLRAAVPACASIGG